MAVNILNTTTLSEALTADQVEFAVGSTANILAGMVLVVRNEAMNVNSIPLSGRVSVTRGWNGTQAFAQPSGAKVWIGTPDKFLAIRATANGLTGTNGVNPQYMLPGSTAIDGAGNEYLMVEMTQTVVPGATVVISRDGNFTASVAIDDVPGPVGVTTEDSSSDQYTWVQRVGFNAHVKLVGGSSLVTSLGEFQATTLVSTPSVGLLGRSSSQRSSAYGELAVIFGMYPNAAASTASTSATSETGLFTSAFLDNPYYNRPVTS
jgi:hypothetical protein